VESFAPAGQAVLQAQSTGPLVVLVAEGAKSGVQRKDVRVTAKVGVIFCLRFPVGSTLIRHVETTYY